MRMLNAIMMSSFRGRMNELWSLKLLVVLCCGDVWVGNSQLKNTAMLDNDDDSSSSVSSSSTSRTDHVSVSVSGNEEVHFDQDGLLDQALDALDEKRYLFFFLIYR